MNHDSGDHSHDDSNPGSVDRNRRYGDYRRRVFCYVRKHHPDVCAEDVAQETLERVLRGRYDSDPGRPVDSLLFKIATNIVHDLRRRRRLASYAPPDLQVPAPAVSPEEQTIDRVDGYLAKLALEQLPPADRKVIELVHFGEVSCLDLSRREHISYAAARKRLSRARHRLCVRFERLSRVALPLVAAFQVLRWLRRHTHTATLAGATGVATVAVAVGLGAGPAGVGGSGYADDVGPGPRTAVVTADAAPSSRDDSPAGSEQHRVPVPAPSASLGTGVAEQPPVPDDASLPLRSSLEVSPDTGAGRKQEHVVVAETPLGPVGTGGDSRATGPASGSACGETAPTVVPGCDASPRVASAGPRGDDPSHLHPLVVAEG